VEGGWSGQLPDPKLDVYIVQCRRMLQFCCKPCTEARLQSQAAYVGYAQLEWAISWFVGSHVKQGAVVHLLEGWTA